MSSKYNWTQVERGTDKFPQLYDFRQYRFVNTQQIEKVGGRSSYIHKPADQYAESMTHAQLDEILSRNGSNAERRLIMDQMILEIRRAYAAYTTVVVGRPFGQFRGTRGRSNASKFARLCVATKLSPAQVLYFWEEVKGTRNWQGTSVIKPGYVIGDTQIMEIMVASDKRRDQFDFGGGSTVNAFDVDDNNELRIKLQDAGFEVDTLDAENLASILVTADSMRESKSMFVPEPLRSMAQWVIDNNWGNNDR